VIRHRPAGRGHPYLVEPDQRVPVRPSSGEAFELRATTRADARGVRVELEVDGERQLLDATQLGDAIPSVLEDYGVPAPRVEDGHLSEAVARLGEQRGRSSWGVTVPGLERGRRVRYRFHGDGGTTRWNELAISAWSGEGGTLRIEGSVTDRVDATSVSWLTDGDRVYALRFALRLEPGERVVGFGERFNGLDQRGKLVDVAVFDQYKGQGARTYIPMPYAIVVGGGFGFHVDTGRRVRFDVGRSDPSLLKVEVDLEPGAVQPELVLRLFAGGPAEVLSAFLAGPRRPCGSTACG